MHQQQGIFDDFSMFYSTFGVFHFEKCKNLAKNEEKPCSTCLKLIFRLNPGTRKSDFGLPDLSLVHIFYFFKIHFRNYYPFTITDYTCSFVPRFSIHIKTRYLNDTGIAENVRHFFKTYKNLL